MLDDDQSSDTVLAELTKPVCDDISAVVEVLVDVSVSDGPPVVISAVEIGASYEPLRRLWRLLGDRVRLIHALGPAPYTHHDRARSSMEVEQPSDALAVADDIARLTLTAAPGFARRHATLDAFLAQHDDRASLMRAALLAAGGRAEEARSALDAHPAGVERISDRVRSELDAHQLMIDPLGFTSSEDRLVFQLRRFIDAGCDPELIPDEMPPRRPPAEPPSWSEQRSRGKAERDALAAVRRGTQSQDRDAQRSALEAELARRGLRQSPLWIEQALDHLWDSPRERGVHTIDHIKSVGRIGATIFKALRGDDDAVPDLSPPDWLRPPEGAFYAADWPRVDDWFVVPIDDAAHEWLERAHDAMARIGPSAVLDAWLSRSDDRADLAVHLGVQRVGCLDETVAAQCAPLVQAAEARGEFACVRARLTPRPGPAAFLLEIGLPGRGHETAAGCVSAPAAP